MSISLRMRIVLAVISGIACALIWVLPKIIDGEAEFLLRAYGLPGLFFGSGVLFPYVSPGKLRYVRYFGLFLASVVSYACALFLVLMGPGSIPGGLFPRPTWLSFTVGSIAGASIVMLALALIAPIRASFAYVLLGVLAAVGGGLFLEYIDFFNGRLRTATGYAVWHTLVCLAIYFGTPSTSAGAKSSAVLAGLFKRQT